MMPLPSIVIAGAPKCGTSTLFAWLAAHPRVCGSTPKETWFLMDQDHPFYDGRYTQEGLGGYARYFPRCADDALLLEATTHYYYQSTARRVLADLAPQPHVIFLLRRPAQRVYSSFRYTQNTLGRLDAGLSFRDFVHMVESRPGDLSEFVSDPTSRYVLQRDIELSRYARHLRSWRTDFPDDRLHVCSFEELRDDPRRLVTRLAREIGIDARFYEDFELTARNRTQHVRAPRLQPLAHQVSKALGPGLIRRSLKAVYLRAQRGSGATTDPDTPRVLRELDASFSEDNRALANEWGFDLSPWTDSESVPRREV